MPHKLITLPLLASALSLMGCQSSVTNIEVSRKLTTGQAITGLDNAARQYQDNVEIYKHAMTDYERAHGDSCGNIMFSSIVALAETTEPRVQICKLHGASPACGYRSYKVRIIYTDDACKIVQAVKVLERMTQ